MKTDAELVAMNQTLRKRAYEVLRPVLPALALSPSEIKQASIGNAALQNALRLHQQRP